MRKKLALLGVCFLSVSFSLCASADILPPGTHELGGSAEIAFPEDGSSIYLGPRFGVVIAPGSELEFEMGYSRTSDGLSNSRLAFLADFIYNFETVSAPYPFMLAGFGFARSHSEWERGGLEYEGDETNGMLNLGAGLRLPVTESGLVRLELRYTREFATPDVSTTTLRAGLSLLLD
ncbi:MAG: hypothetical protein NTX17_03870 [Candidatus Eisenbacteria bacterium]|nr:hypothetical protein [Candidatus Eisenbacteria bacterium]